MGFKDDMNDKLERGSNVGSSLSMQGSLVLGFEPNAQFFYEKTCKFITKWLNDNVQMSKPVEMFPYDLINNGLEQIYDLLKFLNQKTPNKLKSYSKKINEKIDEQIKQYDELIDFLMQKGCLLNTVKS